MRIQVIGVDHRTAPLAALATLSDGEGLSRVLMARQADVAGAVLLSTCNRFELICDTDDSLGPERLRERVRDLVRERLRADDARPCWGLGVHVHNKGGNALEIEILGLGRVDMHERHRPCVREAALLDHPYCLRSCCPIDRVSQHLDGVRVRHLPLLRARLEPASFPSV